MLLIRSIFCSNTLATSLWLSVATNQQHTSRQVSEPKVRSSDACEPLSKYEYELASEPSDTRTIIKKIANHKEGRGG